MKKIIPFALLFIFSIAACDGWSYSVSTFPAPPATITPAIYTPTPLIVTITNTPELPTNTPIPATDTATAFTEAPHATRTPSLPVLALSPNGEKVPPLSPHIMVDVLSCNTSIDIVHGMGEVTNAFVALKNNTGVDMTDLCATLFALDEGRVHPDKTVCVPELGHGQQVTLKLTVDSTYKQDTPIQIEVTSEQSNLPQRFGDESISCTDIGLFMPNPGLMLTPVPIH